MRRLRWNAPHAERRTPKHPYRDTVFVYGGMAAAVVVIAIVTGGDALQAILVAAAFFVIAVLWSWRNWRNRLRAEERQKP